MTILDLSTVFAYPYMAGEWNVQRTHSKDGRVLWRFDLILCLLSNNEYPFDASKDKINVICEVTVRSLRNSTMHNLGIYKGSKKKTQNTQKAALEEQEWNSRKQQTRIREECMRRTNSITPCETANVHCTMKCKTKPSFRRNIHFTMVSVKKVF